MINGNMALWAVAMRETNGTVRIGNWGEREITERWAAYWERTFPGQISVIRNVNDPRILA